MANLTTENITTTPQSARWLRGFWLIIIGFCSVGVAAQTPDTYSVQVRQLMQLAEYIGVDYAEAVVNGEVADQGEYLEMVEFAQLIVDKSVLLTRLSRDRVISEQARTLQLAVANKHNLATVQAQTAALRKTLLELVPQSSLPTTLLSQTQSQNMFNQSCAGCHGESGQGNGIAGANLTPSPTDFTDKNRAINRSILGLYDAIANGIGGTAMPGFEQLSAQQKWSLAFYVGGLAFQSSEPLSLGKVSAQAPVVTLPQLVNFSPKILADDLPAGLQAQIEQLRADPRPLFIDQDQPLVFTRQRLQQAHQAYLEDDLVKAKSLAVSAYLDGFELVENNLDAVNVELRKDLEASLMRLRRVLAQPDNHRSVENVMAVSLQQLARAERLLKETSLSAGALFTASFIILLREGLEALLVVLALVTVLLKTQRRDALKFVHFGWVTALMAGGATWWVAEYLITISGASREVMEGVAALLAAMVLFYVGFWLHNKTNAVQWQQYIQQNINASLKTGTLWGISLLAFIAVYREVFETVLFYQSLLTQAASAQYGHIVGGFAAAVGLLSLLAWLLVKYSVKLPIARFFSITTYLLLGLSFVLIGKAVQALQEASFIAISPLPIELELGWIGISSSWQAVGAQATILLLSMGLVLRGRMAGQAGRTVVG